MVFEKETMRFGLFYEHQLPRPWETGAEEKLLNDALEQVELADRLGFDYVWEVEHHFLEEYSHSSRAGGVPRGRQPADENDPARPRHRPAPARRSTTRAGGGAGGDPRPGVRRARGLRHRRVELGGRARRVRLIDRETKREQWEERSTRSPGCSWRSRSPARGPSTSRCRRATWCRSPSRSPTRRCGWRAAGARPSSSRPGTASARCPSRSSSPRRPASGSKEYYDLIESDECVPVGFDVNPNIAVVIPIDVRRRRGGRDRPRHRRRPLLRLLAAPLLRYRPARARASPTSGPGVPRAAPRVRLRARARSWPTRRRWA